MSNWNEYYKNTKNKPPSKLLIKALSSVVRKEHALDLGAGRLKDSELLLEDGFKKVTAVDKEAEVLQFAKEINRSGLQCYISEFERFEFPKIEYDLVNAQWSLPFISPDKFNDIWKKIILSLKTNGIFVVQLFGINDSWNKPGKQMTFLERKAVEDLLKEFEVIELEEYERASKTASGKEKYWHVYNIIVRKLN